MIDKPMDIVDAKDSISPDTKALQKGLQSLSDQELVGARDYAARVITHAPHNLDFTHTAVRRIADAAQQQNNRHFNNKSFGLNSETFIGAISLVVPVAAGLVAGSALKKRGYGLLGQLLGGAGVTAGVTLLETLTHLYYHGHTTLSIANTLEEDRVRRNMAMIDRELERRAGGKYAGKG